MRPYSIFLLKAHVLKASQGDIFFKDLLSEIPDEILTELNQQAGDKGYIDRIVSFYNAKIKIGIIDELQKEMLDNQDDVLLKDDGPPWPIVGAVHVDGAYKKLIAEKKTDKK